MKIGYHPRESTGNNVTSFLSGNVEEQPTKIAFCYQNNKKIDGTHESMSYEEFGKKVESFSGSLVEIGIKKGDRLIVFAPISSELYISIVGLQRIGAIPVLVDSLSRIEQMKGIMDNAQPVGIIAYGEWLQMIEGNNTKSNNGLRIVIVIGAHGEEQQTAFDFENMTLGKASEIVSVAKDDTALITYTTGSSGIPKGVDRTHNFLSAQHYALKRLFPYKSSDIDLPVFPVFALNNIASGITTVIPAADISRTDPSKSKIIFSQIKECKVNCMTLSPSSFRNLAHFCHENNKRLDGVSRVLTGGAPISENEIKRFIKIAPNSENLILYGSTEVEPISFIESKKMISIDPPLLDNTTQAGVNVGRIDKALAFKIIDIKSEDINENIDLDKIVVGRDKVGELIVSGEHVCDRYYKNKEAFKKTKIVDANEIVWHRTGDLARIDNGWLWVVGRKHNVIRRKGKLFFPVRPEIILKDIRGVANAAYLEITRRDQRSIIAVVTLEEEVRKDEVEDTIFKLFAEKSIPIDSIVPVSEIPMDVRHHSKVDYKKLKQELHEACL